MLKRKKKIKRRKKKDKKKKRKESGPDHDIYTAEFEFKANQMKRDWQAQLLYLCMEHQKPLIIDLASGLYITRWKAPPNFEKFGYQNMDAAFTELEGLGYLETLSDKVFRKASLTEKGRKELEFAMASDPFLFSPILEPSETTPTSIAITTPTPLSSSSFSSSSIFYSF